MSQNRENGPCLSRRKTGFQLGKDSLQGKDEKIPFSEERKGPEGNKAPALLVLPVCNKGSHFAPFQEGAKLPDPESCQVATQLYMFGMVLSSFTTANAGVTPKPTSAFCPP